MACMILLTGLEAVAPVAPVRVLVWSEDTAPKEIYPDDIRGAVAASLNLYREIEASTATITDPEQGLSEKALRSANVLVWWGHRRHRDVNDEYVERVVRRVREGMGFIGLHSGHYSKAFKKLIGPADLGGWREDGNPEFVRIAAPGHPIAEGLVDFIIPRTEMYNEPFNVPEPEAVVLESRWETGERFRSGCTWTVEKGRVFYFSPGHETFPIYYDGNVQRVLRNGVLWAARRA